MEKPGESSTFNGNEQSRKNVGEVVMICIFGSAREKWQNNQVNECVRSSDNGTLSSRGFHF